MSRGYTWCHWTWKNWILAPAMIPLSIVLMFLNRVGTLADKVFDELHDFWWSLSEYK